MNDPDYCAPWQVALRKAPGASVCTDEACELSGGFAHVGVCESCDCGKRHAISECPVRQGMALTQSEVALAKILFAWEALAALQAAIPQDKGPKPLLFIPGFTERGEVTAAGRALLDRAKMAGVLRW